MDKGTEFKRFIYKNRRKREMICKRAMIKEDCGGYGGNWGAEQAGKQFSNRLICCTLILPL